MFVVLEYDYYTSLSRPPIIVDYSRCEHKLYRHMRCWLKEQPRSCINFMSLKNKTAESHAIMWPTYKYCVIRKILKVGGNGGRRK